MLNLQSESIYVDSFVLVVSQSTPDLIIIEFFDTSGVRFSHRDVTNQVFTNRLFFHSDLLSSSIIDVHNHLSYEMNDFLLV